MKKSSLIIFLGCLITICRSQAQDINYYSVIIAGDTFSLPISPEESTEAQLERKLNLNFISNYKTKAVKLDENISADIMLKGDSSIYSAMIYDYFDDYLIAFTGISRQLSKKEVEFPQLGFQKILYDSMESVTTRGKQRFIPQYIAGLGTIVVGGGLTVVSVGDLFMEDRNNFPIWVIPIGLAVTYLGFRILEPVLMKNYLLENWEIEVISTE
jgi:hypothetical protein